MPQDIGTLRYLFLKKLLNIAGDHSQVETWRTRVMGNLAAWYIAVSTTAPIASNGARTGVSPEPAFRTHPIRIGRTMREKSELLYR